MNYIKKIIILFIYCSLPFVGLAWGVEGHRIVGQIAENYLSKKAKKEVAAILGTESIAMCSNWGDFIKSDSTYNYVYKWHYMDLKQSLAEQQVQDYLNKDTIADVYTKINFLAGELKKKDLSQENKLVYLKLLIHFVGDVHQPLHTTDEAQGGNKIKVLWFNEPKNLHQMWDDQLILFQQLSYTEYSAAINHPTKEQVVSWQAEPITKWIWQSYQLSQQIYGDIKQPDQKLEYKYNYKYVSLLNQQLLTGGVHLAGLLNDIFK